MTSEDAENLQEHERQYGISELLRRQVELYGWSKRMAEQERRRQAAYEGMTEAQRDEARRRQPVVMANLSRR